VKPALYAAIVLALCVTNALHGGNLAGCAAAAPAKVVTSELRTVCKDVEQQPEPDYVLFICDVVDATGIAVQTFAVKAPARTAPAFRAAHAPH
jgi:hypothetical protein